MMEDAIQEVIKDAHNMALHCADTAPDLLKWCFESIAVRLERICASGLYITPEAARKFAEAQKDIMDGKSLNAILMNPPSGRTLKMPVISMPGKAAIKYHVDDPELPRLAASIETIKSESGKVSCDCTLYAGNEVLADMQVYRGKSFAVAMVRRALRGAMSKLGKHRRMTTNRQSREAAKKESV